MLLIAAVALLVVAVVLLTLFMAALYVLVVWLNEWAHETTAIVNNLADAQGIRPTWPPRGFKKGPE
jgi:hypothetical protein